MGRDGKGGWLTSHVVVEFVHGDLLFAVGADGRGGVLALGLGAGHVVVADAHGLRGGAFGGGLGGLSSFAGFGAFGYSAGFFVVVEAWGSGEGVVGGRRLGGGGRWVGEWGGGWLHGVLLGWWLLLGVGVVVGVFVCGHCFFDAHVMWLERHCCFLLEGCGL